MTDSRSSFEKQIESRARRLIAGLRGVFAAPGRGLALAVLALLVLVRAFDPVAFEGTRLRGFDLEQLIAPRAYEPLPIRIVAIDGKSLAKYGQWPWPRTLVAQLVGQMAAENPRVLGVDIVFSEPDRLSPGEIAKAPNIPPPLARELKSLPPNEAALADAFRKLPTVLGMGVSSETATGERRPSRITLIRQFGADPKPFLVEYATLLHSLDQITYAERGRGAIAGQPDRDGIVRRVPLFIAAEGHVVPSLALEMLRVASGAHSLGIVTAPGGVRGATLGNIFIPTDRHGRAYPHFTLSYELRYISAADVLDKSYDPAALRGGIVFLGVTGQGLADDQQTPPGLMAGVEVHTQLLECILTGTLLRRPSILDGVEITMAFAMGLVTIFALPYTRPRLAFGEFLGLIVLILGTAFASFGLFNLLLDATYPTVVSVTTFGIMLAANLRAAEAARRGLASELEHEREVEARLEGELNAARAIQIGLLPRHFPGAPERHDVDIYASIEPARMVGGDLYDFLLLDVTRLSFAIADVSGKGVPAALFMAMSKEVLRAATLRHGDALDQVFAEANEKISAASNELLEEGTDMMFVTVFAAVLDLATGALVYVSAGHDSPFVVRRETEMVQLTGEGGPPLGSVDEFTYPVERRQLAPGDLLLLYTDGVTEAQDANHTLYAVSRLRSALALAPKTSAKAVIEFVREDISRFVAGAEQADDITLLAVRWLGAEGSAG